MYYHELSHKVEFKDLPAVFMDKKGRTYYEFDTMDNLPVRRLMKQKEYFEWLNAGINSQNLGQLIEAINENIIAALQITDKRKFAKSMAKVQALVNEIGRRRELIIPMDLFINILCVMIVREDEDPVGFNEKIHAEKCDYFIEHVDDYGFFLQSNAFRELSKSLNMSQKNWNQYYQNWIRENLLLSQHLEKTL
jgi:hypothetical protein